MTIEIGAKAPEFTAKNAAREEVTLADLTARGNVFVIFYPFAFSGICTGELQALQKNLDAFRAAGCEPVVVSCDAPFSLEAFAKDNGFDFTLLSDFWPHGEIAKSYGVFVEDAGAAKRGSFLVDGQGNVAWSVINEIPAARDIDGHLTIAQDNARTQG